ncbi:MAG: hypothetical protein LQ351_006971 [Letrouitia transgressa]|nr:MAG: hypothetical protein LQ351_006971 [Letrouitia transgressa]
MEMDAGQADANPIIVYNKLELVRLLSSWITEHKGARPPACVKWDQKSFENCFGREVTCTNSSNLVWILRLGILDQYMAWIVDYEDGSCQLVRQVYHKQTGYKYQPWLGGDHGFATQQIVSLPKLSGALRIQSYADKKGLDAEDVLNDHAITEFDLASDQIRQQDLDEPTQLDEKQPLSSPVSSPPESSSDGDYRAETKRIRRSAKVKIHKGQRKMKKSPTQPLITTWIKNEDLQTPGYCDQLISTPQISDRRQGPKTSSQACTDTTVNASGFHTLVPNAVNNIRFHFFVANKSLGAIMKTIDLHITRTKFFNQVTKVSQFGAKPKACGRVIAASVAIKGWARPIVVPKQSEESFKHMMEVVREQASASTTGKLDVEVRCRRA